MLRRGVGDGLADRPLDVLGRAGVGRVERPADPLDAHVEVVELLDAAEELGVEAEDVAHLGAGADPVLGREAEDREPADVAPHGDAHEPGEVLLALGVTLGAGQAAAPGPAAVAVHDARDVHGEVGALVRHSASTLRPRPTRDPRPLVWAGSVPDDGTDPARMPPGTRPMRAR